MGSSAIGEMNIILSANAASFSAGIDQAQRKLNQLAGGARSVGGATGNMTTKFQAASGALRLLEGGMTNSLRAGERFLSMLPGVSEALDKMFPVVGAIAFSFILIKVGKEIDEFAEKTKHLPDQIGDAFNALNLSSRTANDELEKANINLENDIAKLEGKPQNNLAVALIDARIAADKLADALQNDANKMEELFNKLHISIGSGIFGGQTPTAAVEASANDRNEEIKELGYQRSDALYQAGRALEAGDKQKAAAFQGRAADLLNQLQEKEQEFLAWTQKQESGTVGQVGMDWPTLLTGAVRNAFSAEPWNQAPLGTSGTTKMLEGIRNQVENEVTAQQEETANAGLGATDKRLQAAKDFTAEQKKIAEQDVQTWRQQLEEEKAVQDMTLRQEAQFWVERALQTHDGLRAVTAAMNEANKLIAQMTAADDKAARAFDAASGGSALDHPDDTKAQAQARMQASQYLHDSQDLETQAPVTEELKTQGAQAVQFAKDLRESIAAQRQNSTAIAEDALRMAVATGQMDKLTAARAQATLHTQEYTDALGRLERAYGEIATDRTTGVKTPLEAAQATAQLNVQQSQMQGQRVVQIAQDQEAIQSQTIAGASMKALNEMVTAWDDMASQIAETLKQTVGGFNDDIVKTLITPRLNHYQVETMFGQTLRAGEGGLLKTGLQSGESAILKSFGLGGGGKRDGSSEPQALWVQIANAADAAGKPVETIPGMSAVGRVVDSIFGRRPAAGAGSGSGLGSGGAEEAGVGVGALPDLVLPDLVSTSMRAAGLPPSVIETTQRAMQNVFGPGAGDPQRPDAAVTAAVAPATTAAQVAANAIFGSGQGGGAQVSTQAGPGGSIALDGALPGATGLASGVDFSSFSPSLNLGQVGQDVDALNTPGSTSITRPSNATANATGGIVSKVAAPVLKSLFQGFFAGGGGQVSTQAGPGGSIAPDGALGAAPALPGAPGLASGMDFSSFSPSLNLGQVGQDVDALNTPGSTSITRPSNATANATGGIVSKVAAPVLKSLFQGFFAGGGDVLADRPAIVGEMGPELFIPHSAGTIVPNHQLGASTVQHTLNVDARGSTDPAQTEAAVNRSMQRYIPHIISASVAATRDQQMRKPGMSR